jgi:hypothetical protein
MVETKTWSTNLKGRDQLRNLRVDGRIVLKMVLEKWDIRMWTRFGWLRMESIEFLLLILSSINRGWYNGLLTA